VVKELMSFCPSSSGSASGENRWSEQAKDSEFSQCKSSAVLALGRVANKGDRMVMKPIAKALSESIRDNDCRLAESAIRSLARLTEKGDSKWSLRVVVIVFDRSLLCPFARALRILVLELFADIGEGGDPLIFKLALAQLQDNDLEVQTQAVRTAGKTWHPDCDRTAPIANLTKGCGDALLRREATFAMQKIDEARVNNIASGARGRCACTVM